MSKTLEKNRKQLAKLDALEGALEAVTSKAAMMKYGKMLLSFILSRTRSGSGVPSYGAQLEELKKLKPATKEERKRLKEKGLLSSKTTPGKSNLTRTGQLLDSMSVVSVDRAHIVVGPTGERDDGNTNKQVGAWVTEGGRPFNMASDVDIRALNEAVRRDIRAAVKRLLTKTK